MGHLDDVQQSYLEHAYVSLHLGFLMLTGAVKAIVHAFFPHLFQKSTTLTARHLNEIIL